MKPTYSSSIGKGSYPALAVDGNINGDYYAVLDRNEMPQRYWFVIDLLFPYMVHHVQVYNRRCLDCSELMLILLAVLYSKVVLVVLCAEVV